LDVSSSPGLKKLRFDRDLTCFAELLQLLSKTRAQDLALNRKVVAKWTFAPSEPIMAVGALPYDPHMREALHHLVFEEDSSITTLGVQAGLSQDFCPWNLALVGSAYGDKTVIPIDLFSITCGCWCESMSKSWYLASQTAGKPFHYFDIPPFKEDLEEWAIDFLISELTLFSNWLGENCGSKVTEDKLATEIRTGNALRSAASQLTALLREDKAPIPALEYYLLMSAMGDFLQDPLALLDVYEKVAAKCNERIRKGTRLTLVDDPFRVFYSGIETQALSVFNMIEDFGGALVGCDTYSPMFESPVSEKGSAFENLAEWIWRSPCNLPTPLRIARTVLQAKRQRADGIIINNVTGCRYPSQTSKLAKDILKSELGVPVLTIETGLPLENLEATEFRIRAFIETNK
jgi:benzoyl-CoA reductase/2-hydroxyglutaryl-CoA dehydratase subunit BcrC/BadD/HgdB